MNVFLAKDFFKSWANMFASTLTDDLLQAHQPARPPSPPIRVLEWKTNLLLLAQAVLFILLIWGVDKALTASRQRQAAYSSQEGADPVAIAQIPDCSTNIYLRKDQSCLTIVYAPQVSGHAVNCSADACCTPK